MRPVRRLFVSIGAPLIVVLGLTVAWGVRQGSAMIRQLEAWGDSLEHSSGPVELRVAGVPIISTMYVDGEKVGKFDRIVILRQERGKVDSLRIVVDVSDPGDLARLSECNLQADPEALDHGGPLDGWKRIMHCTSDTDGLVPFGSVVFGGSGRATTLLLERGLVPCDAGGAKGDCLDMSELGRDMQQLRDEIRRDVRRNVRVRVR